MKALASIVLAGLMGVSLAACAKEEPKQAPVQVAQAVNPQITDAVTAPKPAEPVYKTVCLDVQGRDGKPVIDAKTGKPKQNCTKVRVREKFEGTKIEDAKKK
jgi:multidrug efflux pump subunit AcrA (membrane-fusion protein)